MEERFSRLIELEKVLHEAQKFTVINHPNGAKECEIVGEVIPRPEGITDEQWKKNMLSVKHNLTKKLTDKYGGKVEVEVS